VRRETDRVCFARKESAHGEDDRFIFGLSAMQGWRITMEDAHAAVLDLKSKDSEKPTASDKRLSFFGVYDGHGGDKVAHFAGDNIHTIIAKQEAYRKGEYDQALKDGFLAVDRAILNGWSCVISGTCLGLTHSRSEVQRRGFRLHCICCATLKVQDLCGTLSTNSTSLVLANDK
jgi:serine/threonine protein phosphatase PrpC